MHTETVLDTIRRRRTIRRYSDKEVSDGQVRTLLTAAMSAPSTMGRRPWQFVVVRDPETKRRIAEQLRLHPYIERAPLLIVALADVTASPSWRLDLSAAVENLLLQATAMGLGSAWIGSPDLSLTPPTEKMLAERLDLPENVSLFCFVALGYPAEERLPHDLDPYFVSTRVHYETWDALRFRGE